MTLSAYDFAAMYEADTGPMRWSLTSPSKAYQDEGATVTLRVSTINAVVGAKARLYITGALAGDDDWLERWDDVLNAACARRGCTYTRVGITDGFITIGPNYDGQPIDVTRTSRLDERTEGTQQLDAFLRDHTVGVIARGVVSRWIYDVSLTPYGTPTIDFRTEALGTDINEGESLSFVIKTEFLPKGNSANPGFPEDVPTRFRLYAVNKGSGAVDWTEPFIGPLIRAVQAAGCSYETRAMIYDRYFSMAYRAPPGSPITWTPAQKEAEAESRREANAYAIENANTLIGQVNGIMVYFNAGYSDANPIRWQWQTLRDQLTEDAKEQVDIIIDRIQCSNPKLQVRGKIVSRWIRDTSRSPTPSYWQIEVSPAQPKAGDLVTYRLFSETGVSEGSSVYIDQLGDATDADFDMTLGQAMAQAAQGRSDVYVPGGGGEQFFSGETGWRGEFTWSRRLKATFQGRKLHHLRMRDPSDVSRIVVEDAVAFLGGTGPLPAMPEHGTGLNLAGAEFGSGTTIPGTYGQHYRYPARPEFNVLLDAWKAKGWDLDDYRHQELWYWWTKGCNFVRLPVRWERIQRGLREPLSYGGFTGTWNGSDPFDMARIEDFVRYATKRGIYTLIDIHNYGRYRIAGVSNDLIDVNARPDHVDFYDLMRRLGAWAKDKFVGLNIMNEPAHNIPIEWARICRGAIHAIRSSGFLGHLSIPGIAATGAWSWRDSGNGDAHLTIFDPADNMSHEGHQYLDPDRSGAGEGNAGTCTLNSGYQPRALINWARENGRKCNIGEIGISDPAVVGQEQCGVENGNVLQLFNTNKDVCLFWCAWIGGARANPTDHFKLDPADYLNGPDTPQGLIVMRFFTDGGD